MMIKRRAVSANRNLEREPFENGRINLTGANGKVAKRIGDAAAQRGFRVVTLNRSECAYLLDAEKPRINPDSIVVNCAAFTNTRACEQNREKAVEDNVIFAALISEFCKRRGLRCYYLSTETYLAKTAHLSCRLKMTFLSSNLWRHQRLGELASADFGARVIRLPLLVDIDDPETVFGKLINRLKSGFLIKCSKICYSTPVTYTEVNEGNFGLRNPNNSGG